MKTIEEMQEYLDKELEKNKTTPRQVATHEAGHAVVAMVMKVKVVSASIVPYTNERGDKLAGCVELADMKTVADVCVPSMGGAAAEIAFFGKASFSSFRDVEKAFSAVRENPGPDGVDSSEEVAIYLAHAKNIVVKNKRAVKKVADALLERKKLSGKQIAAIIAAIK